MIGFIISQAAEDVNLESGRETSKDVSISPLPSSNSPHLSCNNLPPQSGLSEPSQDATVSASPRGGAIPQLYKSGKKTENNKSGSKLPPPQGSMAKPCLGAQRSEAERGLRQTQKQPVFPPAALIAMKRRKGIRLRLFSKDVSQAGTYFYLFVIIIRFYSFRVNTFS